MKNIYLNIKYFLKNFYFVYFQTSNKCMSFAGYGRCRLAKKYADKRTEITSPDGVTGRKRHFVFEYGNNIVLVANRTEVNQMIKNKLIGKKVDINYMLEHAYYITK
jgi:hypothetical protein